MFLGLLFKLWLELSVKENNGNVSTNPLELAKIDSLVLRVLLSLKALRPTTKAQSAQRQAITKSLENWRRHDLRGLKDLF